jgi:molecular chaperone GrpE (heat shock protein)
MAELKDAEIAELRREISEHVLRADSLRAEIRRLEEELELDGRDAVSEAVERIVEALEKRRDKIPKDLQSYAMNTAIALLRSRDWSKGEG